MCAEVLGVLEASHANESEDTSALTVLSSFPSYIGKAVLFGPIVHETHGA
jgi:hypothetical protein